MKTTAKRMSIERKEFILKGFADRPISMTMHLASEAQGIVLYAHGINGFAHWGGLDQIADQFATKGLHFLQFNFSHNGTSPEKPTEFVDLEAYAEDSYLKRQFDLLRITAYLDEQADYKALPQYLIGHSRGGVDALLFAKCHKKIAKLITWSAPNHAQTPYLNWPSEKIAEWREKGVIHLENKRTQQQLPIHYQLYAEYQRNKAILNVMETAREFQRPWLIVHGEEDEAVFVDQAYALKSVNESAKAVVIPEASHTYNRKHPWPDNEPLPAATQGVIDESLKFLLGA